MTNYEFKPLYKPNQLIVGSGQSAIVTGWTVKESIAKLLEKHEYAVIGQLYSAARGINFLIRNLLNNPHVREVIIMACTKEDENSGSSQCLADFFFNGFKPGVSETGTECWVIDSKIKGYIDKEIPAEVLEDLRVSVYCYFAQSREDAIQTIRIPLSDLEPWGEPRIFPKNETQSPIIPGHLYGHRIEGKTIAETWVKLIHRIRTTGTLRPTGYDGQWQELIDLMAIITDEPEDFYFPEPNYLPATRDFLASYIPQVLDDAPYKEGVKYTYGQRMRSWFGRDQRQQCIDKLIKEKDAASAVISLWDVKDHEKGGSPCLNHIWFRIVDDVLSMTAIFRSNDMFTAWVSNAMGLRALQRHVLDAIVVGSGDSLTIGPLITISQSAHIYDDCFENADWLIREHYKSDKPDYSDPCGNYLVEVVEDKIQVTQLTPTGEVLKTFTGTHPLKLVREICASSPGILPDHIGYLGIELERAKQSIKEGRVYVQDR